MKAVLYTHDLIPITVLDLDPWMVQYLDQNRQFVLAAYPPFKVDAPSDDELARMTLHTVRITADLIRRGSYEAYMLFTHDEESALILKSAFLPGQLSTINDIKERERARGFFQGLTGGAQW